MATIPLPTNCICDGKVPRCPACLVDAAFMMRSLHPESLSVDMLRRRIPKLTRREAAILLEASRWLPKRYMAR